MRKKNDSVEKTSGLGTFDKAQPSAEEAASDADATAAERAESAPNATDQQALSLEEEVKAVQDRYLRLAAEFENYKKRAQKDQAEYAKYANERLLRELLPVRSEEHTSELQSPCNLVCRLLLEKKKKKKRRH